MASDNARAVAQGFFRAVFFGAGFEHAGQFDKCDTIHIVSVVADAFFIEAQGVTHIRVGIGQVDLFAFCVRDKYNVHIFYG